MQGKGGDAHHPHKLMPAITFPSRYGAYNVTRVTMACTSAPLCGCDGVVTQDVITMEMTDMNETVSVVGATLFKQPTGDVRSVTYDGQRHTITKAQARKMYRSLLCQGYALDRPWIDCDNV